MCIPQIQSIYSPFLHNEYTIFMYTFKLAKNIFLSKKSRHIVITVRRMKYERDDGICTLRFPFDRCYILKVYSFQSSKAACRV